MEPEEQKELPGAVRIGMRWGVIGCFVGFVVCLLGSLLGAFAAIFVGTLCGRRAVEAESGAGSELKTGRPGALAGLIGGALATPGFLLGAATGALVSASAIGWSELASGVADFTGAEIPSEQMRLLFLVSLLLMALLQATLLILSATATGAWSTRK